MANASAKRTLDGRTVLITGAASGIGRALALAFAERGARLALADVDASGLEETAERTKSSGRGRLVTCHALDVSDADAIKALPSAIAEAHGGLDVLVNNAGVALGGRFEEIAETDFDWLMAVNFFGVVRMTRAFLPLLRRSPDGVVCNISSIFGIVATPGQSAYTASKFAVRGFSESLRHELAGSNVGVLTVHPGGVATSIAASARVPPEADPDQAARQKKAFAAALKMPPAQAAAIILGAIEGRKARVLVGNDARVAGTIERLLPVGYWSVLQRLSGRNREV